MIRASFGENMMKPKRDLQGPRPPPLKISKESYKIKKPQDQGNNINKLPRSPVVIHLKSPETIHVRPQDFMNLVQQLTGNPTTLASSKSSVSPQSSSSLFQSKKKDQVNKEEREHVVANHHRLGVSSPNSNMASINYQFSPMFSSLFLPSPNTTAHTNFLDFGPIF